MFDKTFDNSVRTFCRKSGWTIGKSFLADFMITRDPFVIYVLLGPDIFDRRFPIVNAIYMKKIYAILERNKKPNILVPIRDRDTITLYESIGAAHVSILHFDDLAFLNHLTVQLPPVAPPDDRGLNWAINFVSMNSFLCKYLSHQATMAHDVNRALLWSEKAIFAGGQDPMALNELANIRTKLGDLEGAVEALARALKLAPDSATLLNHASRLALRQDRAAEALEFAEQAVESPNKRPHDYNHLARLYLKSANLGAAETAARRALALDPANAQFAETLKQIQTWQARRLA